MFRVNCIEMCPDPSFGPIPRPVPPARQSDHRPQAGPGQCARNAPDSTNEKAGLAPGPFATRRCRVGYRSNSGAAVALASSRSSRSACLRMRSADGPRDGSRRRSMS